MNVLLMLIGVLIVYLAIKLVFRYNWNKGLGVDLRMGRCWYWGQAPGGH